jgi:predicted TIM-barrel fold metal-dependent hydrolase
MRDAITRLGLDTEQIDWAVPEALAAQAADEDDPIRVALDLPELWTRTADEITAFLSQYNRALAEMAEAHPGQIEAYGAINIDDAAAIEQIEVCDRTPGLAGLCLFPHTSNPSEDTSLMQDVVDALASSQGLIMVHPTDGRGLPVENPERLAAVEFMANLFYTGGIDELQDRTFVLTHTAGIHRVLGDSIGMLYYMRKAHWHMRSFMIDYLLHRDLKGEKVLAEAFAD